MTVAGKNENNTYVCIDCGHEWGREDQYDRWPIRFIWSWKHGGWRSWFTTHGWQTMTDRLGRRVFGWTFHFGPVKVAFGPDPMRADDRRGFDHKCQWCGADWYAGKQEAG